MTKVSFIGAGSGFGRRISGDIIARFKNTKDLEISLCDLDQHKLDVVSDFLHKVMEHNGIDKINLTTTTDRTVSIKDADFVIISVSIGGPAYFDEPYESEIRIPEKYGISQAVGDTLGPGAIFRCMRSTPEIIRMVKDVNRLAPNSVILNLTNPMAMLTGIIKKYAKVPVIGLCHGVSYNSNLLAERMNLPLEEISFTTAGINHMTWFIGARHNGEDILPKLKECVLNFHPEKQGSQDYRMRAPITREFGYFPTESDRHIFEYVPWFQHLNSSEFNAYREMIKGVKEKRVHWYKDSGITAEEYESLELVLSSEAASGIIHAMVTGTPYVFSANVENEGYIENLPREAIVEVPCTVDANGFHPHFVGKLPTACAALCQTNINEQLLMMEAVCENDKQKAILALILDPSVSAKLTIDQIKELFEEMWAKEIELGMELLGEFPINE